MPQCSVYTKMCVWGEVVCWWLFSAAGKNITVKCCKENIHKRAIQNHRYWFDSLYLRLMALLWEPLKKKKKITREVYSIKSQEPQRTQIMTLQHVHYLFIFHWDADNLESNNKIRPSSQYHVFFNCSITISARQHPVPDSPCQKPLVMAG